MSDAGMSGRVLSVASECVPLIKTGGLADVAGALPRALAAQGWDMRVLIPAYSGIAARFADLATVWETHDLFGGHARVLQGTLDGGTFLLLQAPHLYDRPGGPYLSPAGFDHWDNPERFAALSWAAMEIARGGLYDGWRPEVVHAHDWQGALLPVYLRYQDVPVPSVLTIHNIAFQGVVDRERLPALRLPDWAFTSGALEYWGRISVLKGGIEMAGRVTTVSPSYARELIRPEFGMGLEGVIAARGASVEGILNGIDDAVWNPETDPEITPFSLRKPRGKEVNRESLIAEFGLADVPGPLAVIVSRMSWQKGLDIVPDALEGFVARGGALAILGSGEPAIETALSAAAVRFPGRVAVRHGYDEALSHRMFAGADAVLVPSRFEPCGLTQMYALRYGAIPVVAAVGGLADTVINANPAALSQGIATGIVFTRVDSLGLSQALDQLCMLHAQPTLFRAMQRAGMKQQMGWARSAAEYARVYGELTA